jgi:hypothetical protein
MSMKHFKKFVPFEKVAEEPEGVRVWAIATKEELDRHGEVVSYEASKVAFKDFAEWFEKTTTNAGQDPSKGTLRVMHQPLVAGKMLDYSCDDVNKCIPVSLLVTDKEQGRKVKNGEYTGISIGGGEVEWKSQDWEGKQVPWAMKYKLDELSLVDTPACNSAVYTLVKRAGVAEASTAPDGAPLQKTEEPSPKPPKVVMTGLDPFADPKDRKSPAEIAREQGEELAKNKAAINPTTAGRGEPAPAASETPQTPGEGAASAARSLTPELAKRFGPIVHALTPSLKKYSESGSLYPLLCALRDMQSFMDAEDFEAVVMGADPAQQTTDIQAAGAIVTALIALIETEFEQQVRSYKAPEPAIAAVKLCDDLAGLAKYLSPTAIQKLASEPEVKDNMTAIHQMGHALVKASSALGAECPDGQCPADDGGDEPKPKEDVGEGGESKDTGDEPKPKEEEDASKGIVAQPITAAIPNGNAEQLQKVLDAVTKIGDQVKVQGSELATVKDGIAKLPGQIKSIGERLLKIEKLPAPVGRPAARPVDKSLGPGGEVIANIDEAEALQKLAAGEKDPARKQMLVMMAAERTVPPYAPTR